MAKRSNIRDLIHENTGKNCLFLINIGALVPKTTSMQPILSLCTATAAFFRFRLGLCLLAGAAAATSWPVAPAQARATANTSAQSQNIPSIRGEVRDARNGQPLTGASVVLKGTSLGATTDLNGKFTLQGNLESGRSYPLVVSYIGYNTENTNGVAGGKPWWYGSPRVPLTFRG